ncbi:MAG: phospholipid carrier-dependent glycosyltransferase [Casimicrobiaceae bacterium]
MLASLSRNTWWLLALAAALIWFAGLDARRLQHPDEGRYAEIAREMAVSGDFVTPRLNDLKYFEKPPLQYWIGALTFRAFGVTEWTARLPAALAGFLAVLVVGWTAARLAGPTTGAYAALTLLGCVWHAGLSHFLTLDAVLAFWLTVALCGFLLAQRDALSTTSQRHWMWIAYAAAAGATLTKGLVALVIPGATLVLYSLVTRDGGPWRRLFAGSGTLLYLLLTAPWFVLVARANPEFLRFFFVHEHLDRFLGDSHNRTGEWWYFVPWFVLGIMPWLLVWLVTLPRSWRDAATAANGFAWTRFCIVWGAFIFLFFSISGSKLPSYILPMFPALALVVGYEMTRLSTRVLAWIALPLAVGASGLVVAWLVAYPRLVGALADPITPAAIYQEFGPWIGATFTVFAVGGTLALVLFRRGSAPAKTCGIATLALTTLLALQLAFVGQDSFRNVRSSWDLLAAAQRADGGMLDPALPVYQVHGYDQTLPFYLQRPTPLVAYRDEMTLGLEAEPHKGFNEAEWLIVWQAAPQAFAMMPRETAALLAAKGVPMRVLATDPRRVFVARR